MKNWSGIQQDSNFLFCMPSGTATSAKTELLALAHAVTLVGKLTRAYSLDPKVHFLTDSEVVCQWLHSGSVESNDR